MSTATAPARRLDHAPTGARTGGVGTVLAFAGLSLGLAAAATLGASRRRSSLRPRARPDGVRTAVRLARGRWRPSTAPRDGGPAPEPARLVCARRASPRLGIRRRRRRHRAGRPGGRRLRPGLPGDRHRPVDRADPGLRGGDRVARLRGHPAAALDVATRGGAAARRPVGRDPPLPPAARPDERRSRLVADGRQPAQLLRDPHVRLRLERWQRPPRRACPRRAQRCRAADGRPRRRPHLDHPGRPDRLPCCRGRRHRRRPPPAAGSLARQLDR